MKTPDPDADRDTGRAASAAHAAPEGCPHASRPLAHRPSTHWSGPHWSGPHWSGLPWAVASALGLWLGLANDLADAPCLGLAVLLWPVGLTALGLRARDGLAALRRGWLASLAGGVAALYWLALPVHDVGGLPWALAVPCAVFIAACITSAGGLYCLAAHRWRGLSPWRLAPALALAWYLLEWSYAVVLGFPWLALAGGLAAWPVAVQGADILGAYGTGALWLWAVLLAFFAAPCIWPAPPALSVRDMRETRAGQNAPAAPGPRRACRGGLLASALCLAGLLLGYGAWQLARHAPVRLPEGPDSLGVLFVEGNVDQGQKWLPAMQRATVDLYVSLTWRGLDALRGPAHAGAGAITGPLTPYQAGARPDAAGAQAAPHRLMPDKPLIIWPETALPFFFETRPALANRVRLLARDSGCPILFGAPGVERADAAGPGGAAAPGGETAIFNRAFLLAPDGSLAGSYDKVHLVPFGEYLPSWLDWPFLEALLQGVGVYSEGRSAEPLRFGDLALGMLICYEGIFPWLAQERVARGANILADISNDGWFRDTPAARQHLRLTLLRCLEQNRWLLRGTNTGISVVADTRGRVVAAGPQFSAGAWAARARLETTASIYHALAPWLPGCGALALLALCAPLVRAGWLRGRRESRAA